MLRSAIIAVAIALFSLSLPHFGIAEPWNSPTKDPADAVRFDAADNEVRGHLERMLAYIRENQYDEGVETARMLIAQQGDKLVESGDYRCVTVREYCFRQMSSWADKAPEALKLYRSRVDGTARKWYEDGRNQRDEVLLRRVVTQVYPSSYGDDALLLLGEMALQRADYDEARRCWSQLDPGSRTSEGRPLWLKLREDAARAKEDRLPAIQPAKLAGEQWLYYPDGEVDPAEVRARLVLTSIRAGQIERARLELAAFREQHADTKGRLAGRDVTWADALAEQLTEATKTPPSYPVPDWSTFGGAVTRNRVLREPLTAAPIAWPAIELGTRLAADVEVMRRFTFAQTRVAEDAQELLSYHPVITGHLLLVQNEQQVRAFDVRTGGPAWEGSKAAVPGVIYQEPVEETSRNGLRRNVLGAPRFTATVFNDRYFTRMGTSVTVGTLDAPPKDSGPLVCLDLLAQGTLRWKALPGEKLSFEGAPVVDNTGVYVAMRYNDVRPQCHVAAFDPDTGKLKWRRMICSADTITHGDCEEITHNLLTLSGDTLYLNTNSGAIAAISKLDGSIQWLSLYPRARARERDLTKGAMHYFRDLNPVILDNGTLYAAPTDCPSIFAIDAATGTLLWSTDRAADAIHLLGVSHNRLIATGQRVWWLDATSGLVKGLFPDQANPTPKGYGRGLLAGDAVFWPTRGAIEVFSIATGERRAPITLDHPPRQLDSGNLVAGGGYLLIATPTRLQALGPPAGKDKATPELTQREE